MQRFKLVAVIALFLAVLVGCGEETPALQTITGIVDTVKSEGTGNFPERYFMLEDRSDVFTCFADDVKNCFVLETGKSISMQVDENLTVDSLEYVESQ